MNIVITMAGLGSRFRKAGYTIPKYMIEVHGKTLFEWSVISLSGFCDIANKYIFIVRKEDNASQFISDKCSDLNIRDFNIVEIDYLTDGQATTTMFASKYWNKDEPLMIYNIDTYVEVGEMKSSQIQGDGFIPCFRAQGDHWSFVKLGENGKAVEVREKQPISDNCTLGAYYFNSCELYENLYTEYYKERNNLEKGEAYVAPLYNLLIQKAGDVYISIIDFEKVHVLGTPEELDTFKNQII
ncbi:glycosyltransferase family 2 protein [Paenibacillus sp. GP183]|uniref:glycosyltransferase family 2 protein n=1 Tax=Paenibacillus sp. GP183 TaxID=1882751 RepID=UPI0008979170|nr:glycosyltransferase family 2 protein [Paenibacillus sp. GP183]SEC12508.1 dTDP-glucose pyrophosphorylase [Paenibacillus sp. GP183]